MRYLTRSFALGALRRGSGIEQFPGAVEVAGAAGIRWVDVNPWSDGEYHISLHTVQDLDDAGVELSLHLSLDPVDEQYPGEGRELGRCSDETEAIELAERLTGASPDRWVNFAMAGDEYADFIRARRAATPKPLEQDDSTRETRPPSSDV